MLKIRIMMERRMPKRKPRKSNLIKQAEQIASRAWHEEGKFECQYQDEIAAMINRLTDIAGLCQKCSEENNLKPTFYREIKCVLEVWKTVMEALEKG